MGGAIFTAIVIFGAFVAVTNPQLVGEISRSIPPDYMQYVPVAIVAVLILALGYMFVTGGGSAPKISASTSPFGIIVTLMIGGVIVLGLITYLPGQLDQRYAGQGQVIGMVNPTGNNAANDLQYSQVNQGNAEANLTNARAYQRTSVIWISWVFGAGIFGVIIFFLTILSKLKP